VSTRWFFSHVRQGVAAEGPAASTIQPHVVFKRSIAADAIKAVGPALRLAGPGDVAAIDRSLVIREEPPPGTPAAAENIMAAVEFAYADLPWLLSTKEEPVPGSADKRVYPWLVLVVLSEDEAAPPRDQNPAPILTAPLSALPPLNESWAWAHVEARLDDAVQDPAVAKQLLRKGVRQRSAAVVARLLCPRKLRSDTTYIAAVVPAPASGRWPAAAGASTVELTVFHWWSFHTGKAGTFEDLARRLRKVNASNLGVGARTIDVTAPWPAESPADATQPTARVTMAMDGALRAPGNPDSETWSDRTAQDKFRAKLVTVLNTPTSRRDSPAGDQRGTLAVGPPIYGSHHSGEQTVEPESGGWITTLNLEVRRRVAAALGARYVQVEQEFLMARAWEQVGAIREANRLLAAAELATVAANASRSKNINPLKAADFILTMAPMAARIDVPKGFQALTDPAPDGDDQPATLAQVLRRSRVPQGMPTTAYARLTRRGGALSRRIKRATGSPTADVSKIETGLPQPRPGMPSLAGGEPPTLVNLVRARTTPLALQFRRMADVIANEDFLARSVGEERPLAPLMKHPQFKVPIAEEILARWPEWAIPGITGLPEESVMVVETNPGFVAALLVGLNHEFNRELLWREFPTDQRGTPFARFWPTKGNDVDEIARWPVAAKLGSQLRGGEEGSIVLLMRGEVLRRFPATPLVAVKGVDGKLPEDFTGMIPATPLPLDDSTMLYIFAGLTDTRARNEDWFFVLREPMRGTQFGFDLPPEPPAQRPAVQTWADLLWEDVALTNGFVRVASPPARQPPANAGLARWGSESADMARIAFQQPFQLAFRASAWLD
jgi:hypothetical protein